MTDQSTTSYKPLMLYEPEERLIQLNILKQNLENTYDSKNTEMYKRILNGEQTIPKLHILSIISISIIIGLILGVFETFLPFLACYITTSLLEYYNYIPFNLTQYITICYMIGILTQYSCKYAYNEFTSYLSNTRMEDGKTFAERDKLIKECQEQLITINKIIHETKIELLESSKFNMVG